MFGIDMGPSPQQNQQYGNLTSAGGFATGQGESDITASSKFMQDILSGDSSRISTALAPQIGNAKTSAQQQNKTTAESGTRSGGTAASTAATNDKVHSDITNLIGSLTGSSASSLATSGSNLLTTGIDASKAAFDEASKIQQEKSAKVDDIFGSIASTAGAVAGLPGVGKSVSQGLNAFAGIG